MEMTFPTVSSRRERKLERSICSIGILQVLVQAKLSVV